MLPLAVGLAQTFGLLGLLGIPLNPANMIALPLLLGISVDEGVHIVHDFLDQKGKYKIRNPRPWPCWSIRSRRSSALAR